MTEKWLLEQFGRYPTTNQRFICSVIPALRRGYLDAIGTDSILLRLVAGRANGTRIAAELRAARLPRRSAAMTEKWTLEQLRRYRPPISGSFAPSYPRSVAGISMQSAQTRFC